MFTICFWIKYLSTLFFHTLSLIFEDQNKLIYSNFYLLSEQDGDDDGDVVAAAGGEEQTQAAEQTTAEGEGQAEPEADQTQQAEE